MRRRPALRAGPTARPSRRRGCCCRRCQPEPSTFTDVSPTLSTWGIPPGLHLEPPLNDRAKLKCSPGHETYSSPFGPDAIDGSPPPSCGPTFASEALNVGVLPAKATPTDVTNTASAQDTPTRAILMERWRMRFSSQGPVGLGRTRVCRCPNVVPG